MGWSMKYKQYEIFGSFLYHNEVFIRTPDDELLPNMFFNIQQAHNWIDAHIEAERNHNGNQ